MKRFRRRRRAQWNWASHSSLTLLDTAEGGTSLGIADGTLFPAARTDWLLENGRGRDHITIAGILLWLDFFVTNLDTSLAHPLVDNVYFWILRNQTNNATLTPGPADQMFPYDEPVIPALMTSWDASGPDENDGLDPYLWTHTLNPSISSFRSWGTANGFAPIVSEVVPAVGSVQVANGSPLSVRGGWQPDVHIKTRRRLERGQGLSIGMTIPNPNNTGMGYNFRWHARVLTS